MSLLHPVSHALEICLGLFSWERQDLKRERENMQGLLRAGLNTDTIMEVVCLAAESHCKGHESKGARNYDHQCYQ